MVARAEVLIVDDDPMVGQTFARMLRVSGYSATVVRSVEEAVDAASQHLPDLILSDLRMPLVDGMGLLTRVRRSPLLREVPVAIVTGDRFLSEELSAELRSYGAAVCFKPLFLRDLIALVERLLAPAGRSPQ